METKSKSTWGGLRDLHIVVHVCKYCGGTFKGQSIYKHVSACERKHRHSRVMDWARKDNVPK